MKNSSIQNPVHLKKKCLFLHTADLLSQLNGSARLNSEVQLIPLNMNRVGARNRCITAGWGDIGDNRTVADRLQEVNVTTLSQRSCRFRWGQGRVPIARSMICGVGRAAVQGFCSVKAAQLIHPRFYFSKIGRLHLHSFLTLTYLNKIRHGCSYI